jgi:hypothetical protein
MLFSNRKLEEGTAETTSYQEVEKIIHGQKVLVKVYESEADKIIMLQRKRNEAAPCQKGFKNR